MIFQREKLSRFSFTECDAPLKKKHNAENEKIKIGVVK